MPANFLDVPPELCAIIAHFASRQSLAVLCSVSRRLCSVFSSLLYANTIDPPLESAQFSQLMKTLSNPQTLNWKHHPAVFIRHLRLTDCGGRRLTNVESQAELSFDVLRNTYRLIPRSEHFTGSALRSLHWNLAAGLDELEQIIGAPGQFPNLKKLVVSCNGQGSDFSLKLKMSFNLYTFPFLERDTLLGAMNLIHFPFLTTLCLSVDFYPDEDDIDEDRLPTMDFSPFLAAHPTLVALSLSAHGTRLTQDAAFLPRVRSFKGSFEDSAVICAHPTRHLDQLVLTLLHKSHFEPPSFYTDPLPVQTSLSKLQVLAVDAGGSAVKMTNELSPASLVHLVKSFPNLLHVDICIVGNLITTSGETTRKILAPAVVAAVAQVAILN
ncbi:hypothetical protein DFH06DRAFT_1132784 [Mycena polygramma]|nr:hypothetical protein DFH06DRAFT_1132784 [Mycena polygramma]